ncbi:MAG: type III-B CRISPR module-associated protein Cmr5 [Anaerolineae bacterium]|nr:type III-B CRISPR module-associated protein Cmr5 [Anaerolineae bacterium]
MSSKRQTIEQKRAAQAYKDVTNVDNVDQQYRAELGRKYNSLARSAPALVQSNGLGQALAFWRAKAGRDKKGEHWLLYSHVSTWVMQELKADPQEALLEWVVQQDTQTYRRATTETMAYLNWLKRFAEALLPESAANEQ